MPALASGPFRPHYPHHPEKRNNTASNGKTPRVTATAASLTLTSAGYALKSAETRATATLSLNIGVKSLLMLQYIAAAVERGDRAALFSFGGGSSPSPGPIRQEATSSASSSPRA